VPSLLERLGVELPIVQAGMGGGLSRHELAAAVSEAGGLGTIAVSGAAAIRRELTAARALTGRPLAVNVLLPFARRDWFEAVADADVVVTFWGRPRRRTPRVWLHQCGSVVEAREAHRAGADGVILQGAEAGGHVRGTVPALRLLEQACATLPPEYPLLLAGGVAERGDVRAALEAGATAAVAGTRFLLSEESHAHPGYKDRLAGASETLLTDLFGAGWPAPHRVVPNAATEQWLGVRPLEGISPQKDERRLVRGPLANRALNRLLVPGALHAACLAAGDDAPPASGQSPAHPGRADGRRAGDAGRCRRSLRGGDRGADRRGPPGGGARPRARRLTGRALRTEDPGELDLWSVERLQAVLQRVAGDNDAVLVGLERCEFVDSTGIALFLQARRQLQGKGGRLLLYGPSEQVLRIFTVAGLTDAGMVFAGRDEAIKELAVVE
jgi:nitronate monooxygenase